RDQYIFQVASAFKEKPFFGVGLSNFTYASKKYASTTFYRSSSAHNLFLDILVENGIFSLAVFLLIILFIIIASLKNINGLFFVFIAMLINFQTDYTHTIYSFFLLFFIIGGVIWQEGSKLSRYRLKPRSPFILSTTIFILVNLTIWSNLAFKNQKPRLGFFLYPLNKQACFFLTDEKILNFCGRFYSSDFKVLENIGRIYEQQNKEKKVLSYYTKAYQADQFAGFSLVKKIYNLKNKLEGENEAKKFIREVFCRYTSLKDSDFVPIPTEVEITNLFLEMKNLQCPK
ncbi:O-antigen ligase family protein, partial [Candidatus Gribaldobacteria bacterium]|nr:O-antigen ligase family protein [Candidatus Gribaldobacteria bacterium]